MVGELECVEEGHLTGAGYGRHGKVEGKEGCVQIWAEKSSLLGLRDYVGVGAAKGTNEEQGHEPVVWYFSSFVLDLFMITCSLTYTRVTLLLKKTRVLNMQTFLYLNYLSAISPQVFFL